MVYKIEEICKHLLIYLENKLKLKKEKILKYLSRAQKQAVKLKLKMFFFLMMEKRNKLAILILNLYLLKVKQFHMEKKIKYQSIKRKEEKDMRKKEDINKNFQ